MNDKQDNIKEFEKKKKEITEYLTHQIDISSEILGRAYGCFVDCKVELNIIPIEEQGEE